MAAAGVWSGHRLNSGQACIAGTRILVPSHRLDNVLAMLKQEIKSFKVGAPDDPDAMIGPMVSQKQYDRVQSYIELGMQKGANLGTGSRGGLPGWIAAGSRSRPYSPASTTRCASRMQALADRLDSGSVVINGAPHEPLAPFGGFKQSGIGRESGLEAFLEPKAIIA